MEVLIAAAALVAIIAGLGGYAWRPAGLADRWQQAARMLDFEDTSEAARLRMTGSHRGLAVEVTYDLGYSLQGRKTVVVVRGDFSPDLRVRIDGTGRLPTAGVGRRRLLIGDERFDRSVLLEGDDHIARALMTPATREALLDPLISGARLTDEALTWSQIGPPDPERFPQRLRALTRLGQRLLLNEDIVDRLSANACGDPLTDVRLRNLELLARQRPDAPQTLAAARICLDSTYAPLALRAALMLGDDGLPRIEHLLGADSLPPLLRAEALTALGARGEDGLLTLTHDPALDVRLVAVRALGHCGRLSAVEPLTLYQQGLIFPEERAAARRAIDRIQARHGGGERGAVSLLAGEGGAIALVDGESAVGDVSIVTEPGDVSLTEEPRWNS